MKQSIPKLTETQQSTTAEKVVIGTACQVYDIYLAMYVCEYDAHTTRQ